MTPTAYTLLLRESLAKLEDAEKWLRRSYDICRAIGSCETFSEEEYDAFETFTSRFARVSDMILQKVFRNIDKLELEDGGTLLDVLNRAEKRTLIDSVDHFRELRELRNEITHEYSLDELKELFASVLKHTPELFTIITNIRNYCKRYTED